MAKRDKQVEDMRKEAKTHAEACPVGQALTSVADFLEAMTGPAQVATEAYRQNWETIFGKPVEAGQC
jgi:hypothetical protein